ncbi:uroporphyrinogen-III synthase [Neobacillus cucumis]|uniref:uroporphyrinogen-III synthase n=1 Tax=Neobacillus cucumis TaxID=1740721 RepID=UPI002E237B78|nr:uroporphyrinogen-III synthase [Neobacillus cucumis]
MSDASPLLGQKVLVPRGKDQAKSFSTLVERYGGIPVEIPLIAFRPIAITRRLQDCLAALDTYDWIIFTSNVTVETFFSYYDRDVSTLPKIAVIGKKTAEVLQAKGIQVTFVPSVYVAETFAEEFLPVVNHSTKVLLPKGNLAREHIAASLSEAGVRVDEVVIYETYLPEESRLRLAQLLSQHELDILTFTSPSTVDHLMEVVSEFGLEKQLKNCIIGCIGPTTEKKLLEYGLTVHASPKKFTVKDMIQSIMVYLENN